MHEFLCEARCLSFSNSYNEKGVWEMVEMLFVHRNHEDGLDHECQFYVVAYWRNVVSFRAGEFYSKSNFNSNRFLGQFVFPTPIT